MPFFSSSKSKRSLLRVMKSWHTYFINTQHWESFFSTSWKSPRNKAQQIRLDRHLCKHAKQSIVNKKKGWRKRKKSFSTIVYYNQLFVVLLVVTNGMKKVFSFFCLYLSIKQILMDESTREGLYEVLSTAAAGGEKVWRQIELANWEGFFLWVERVCLFSMSSKFRSFSCCFKA